MTYRLNPGHKLVFVWPIRNGEKKIKKISMYHDTFKMI
jgi:hypothetical protein